MPPLMTQHERRLDEQLQELTSENKRLKSGAEESDRAKEAELQMLRAARQQADEEREEAVEVCA